jgi:hypothetical protein
MKIKAIRKKWEDALANKKSSADDTTDFFEVLQKKPTDVKALVEKFLEEKKERAILICKLHVTKDYKNKQTMQITRDEDAKPLFGFRVSSQQLKTITYKLSDDEQDFEDFDLDSFS